MKTRNRAGRVFYFEANLKLLASGSNSQAAGRARLLSVEIHAGFSHGFAFLMEVNETSRKFTKK
jgi:hypothetical protein